MKRGFGLVVAFGIGVAVTALVAAWLVRGGYLPLGAAQQTTSAPVQSGATRYHCPMHPGYVSDKPGDCPICGMRLVPIDSPAATAEPVPPKWGKRIVYRSTMNPNEVSDTPGKDSMGMEMVPVEIGDEPTQAVTGYATVSIAPRRLQEIGVRTAVVARHRLDSEILSVGRVTYDESRLREVNARVGGWIEVLHADRTGQFVGRGDPLLEIYSPALVSAQEEYRLARDHLRTLEQAGALPVAIEQAADLVADVRRRLELWEIPAEQLLAFEEDGEFVRRVTLPAPASGYVVEKDVLQGQQIEAGRTLFRIADLSQVWVLAEVYESEAPRIATGMPVELRLSYLPGRTFRGKVDYIYPYLDPATRTIAVRIVVPNPGPEMRPEMYAEVRFEGRTASPVVAVPNEAILDTGRRKIAFVALGGGTFEPRELVAGQRTREYTEVRSGLAEGESVVTSGNFLIDSESRLQAVLSGTQAPLQEHRH